MSTKEDFGVVPPAIILNHGTLWAFAVPLIIVGATLRVYAQDIASWIADLSDPLKLVVSEYLIAIAGGVLMPIGAMLITISILVRVYEKSSAIQTP